MHLLILTRQEGTISGGASGALLRDRSIFDFIQTRISPVLHTKRGNNKPPRADPDAAWRAGDSQCKVESRTCYRSGLFAARASPSAVCRLRFKIFHVALR